MVSHVGATFGQYQIIFSRICKIFQWIHWNCMVIFCNLGGNLRPLVLFPWEMPKIFNIWPWCTIMHPIFWHIPIINNAIVNCDILFQVKLVWILPQSSHSYIGYYQQMLLYIIHIGGYKIFIWFWNVRNILGSLYPEVFTMISQLEPDISTGSV